MKDSERASTIFYQTVDPVLQAVIALGAGLLITILSKVVHATGIMAVGPKFPWMSAAAFLLLFAVGNSVFSLAATNLTRYWSRSIYSFGGLALASGLIAWGLSSLTIFEAGSYRWIFIVVTFGYLVFVSIVNFIRRIVDFAEKEEWNSPKLRRRK